MEKPTSPIATRSLSLMYLSSNLFMLAGGTRRERPPLAVVKSPRRDTKDT